MAATVAPNALPAPVPLSDVEATVLLEIARDAIATATGPGGGGEDAATREPGPRPDRRGAAFVTLFADGELRGCIGMMDPARPLGESVADAAVAAAQFDPRFDPLRSSELPRLRIVVSVLGPLVALTDPLAFRLGVDGVVVERGSARGLLLPEVAAEHHLGHEEMLGIACRKAGLPAGSWRDAHTTVFAFRTAHVEGPAKVGIAVPSPTV